jgi:hypothetical protein
VLTGSSIAEIEVLAAAGADNLEGRPDAIEGCYRGKSSCTSQSIFLRAHFV